MLRRALIYSTSVLALGLSTLAAGAAQAQTASDGAQVLDELVITARKRAETIQDVPVSVSAFTAENLARAGVDDFSALATRVPGVSIQEGGAAYRTVYMRGVSTEVGGAATTGFYLDEAFVEPGGIVRTIVEPNYFDIERLEVLRGPQGTLFGGSSMGGAIRVINNKPDLSASSAAFGTELSGTQRGGFNYQFDGVMNVPIDTDRLGFRLAASYKRLDGVVDRLVGDFSGPGRSAIGPVTRHENSDVQESVNLRLALTYKPNDRVTISPSFYYVKAVSADFSSIDIEGASTRGDFEAKHYVDMREPIDDRTVIANLTATFDLGWGELLSSTSYIERDSYFIENLTNVLAETYQPAVVVPFAQFLMGDPTFDFPPGVRFGSSGKGLNNETSWQHEVRISSKGEGRLQYVVGAYMEERKVIGGFDMRVDGFESYFLNLGGPGALAVASIAPDDKFFLSTVDGRRRQIAVFGEATYKLTDSLTATAGLRYYNYRLKHQTYGLEGFLFGGPGAPSVNTPSTDKGYSPRVSLAYQPSKNLTLYAQAAKGFRPGGTNTPVPPSCDADVAAAGLAIGPNGEFPGYKSDKLWNYEVGAKTSMLDRRLTVNQALYRMDWSDIQNLAVFPTCGFGYTANFGKARIEGSETEVVYRPTPSLTLTGALAYTRAQLLEDVPSVAGATAGDQLPTVPKFTANASAEYRFPVGGTREGFVLVNYNYVGSSYRDFLNRPGRNNLEPGVDLGARRKQDAYGMVNARLGVGGDGWNAAVFVDNVFDVQPRLFWFASSLSYARSHDRLFVPRPRTVGVTLRRDF